MDKVRSELRTKHYNRKTETAYSNWIRRFILFNDKRHLKYMGAEEIKSFVDNLVTNHHVSSATQNQALQGPLFLYKNILNKDVGWIENIKRGSRVKHLPVVFSRNEAAEIIKNLDGTVKLIVSLLYGSGMRLGKVLSLRVKDIDFEMNHIIVRDGKGEQDRITVLPQKLVPILKEHIRKVKNLHDKDLKDGFGRTKLPYALAKKYTNANKKPVGSMFFRQATLFMIKKIN